MSSRMQLSPAELDRLEDALEDLELLPPPDVDEDDLVGQQLLEYRELLQLSREAMPLEEVPSGLLDDVLEQARQAAANTAPASGPSWWARLRMGTWVPTLAFAGSAALLLVLLWPTGEEAEDSTVARADPRAEATPASTPPPPPAPEGEAEPLADAMLEQREDEAQDPFAPGQPARGDALGLEGLEAERKKMEAELEEDAKPAESRGKRKAGASTGSSTNRAPSVGGTKADKGADKGYEPPAEPKPQSKSTSDSLDDEKTGSGDLMREIQQGHAARRAGNCGLAKMRYDKARKSEDDHIRALALAGKGLCEAAAGNATMAKKLFEQARAADSSVDSFIEAELRALDQAPPSAEPAAAEEVEQRQ